MASRPVDLEGRPVSPLVNVVPKVRVTLRFVHEHFGLMVPAQRLAAVRAEADASKRERTLRNVVRVLPDVEEIPKGAKAREVEELVRKALTEPLQEWLDREEGL